MPHHLAKKLGSSLRATAMVSDYEYFLAAQHWLTIDDSVFNRALHLRAHHGLKTPDSLHLATALHHDCKEFWTNDDRLSKAAGIVPARASEDAMHISIATVHFVDYLLTWNCRHIANPEIQARIAEHFQQQGLFLPFICTPDELLGDDDD